MLTAGEIMTDKLVTVRPDDSIEHAIQLLLEEEISGMPVADERGYLIGVITEFALLGVVYDHKIKNQTVGQHMTRELITVDISDPVSRVADLCIVHRVRRVPVMKNGRLVGVIARRDVLRALHEAAEAVCAI
jgi:CBS domain-containing protein